MSGKTVINISVEVIRNTTLPAVTLCIEGVDFIKMVLSTKNSSIFNEHYLVKSENLNISTINAIEHFFLDIYYKTMNSYFDSNEKYLKMKDILKNLRPSVNRLNKTILNAAIHDLSVYGEIDKDLIVTKGIMIKSSPMESLKIYQVGNLPRISNCYTFFSDSESSWNNIKMIFASFSIYLDLDSTYFRTVSKEIFIHSPNTMPYEGISRIYIGFRYLIKYSKWNIKRLGKGYDTDCREYDPKIYTRNDCIFDCYQQRGKHYCKDQNFIGSYIIKKKIFFEKSNLNLSKCSIGIEIYHEILEFCFHQCNKECDITYYSFTIDKLYEIDIYKTEFTFHQSHMPDLTIRHIPEMSLLTFYCNFGGILGMWLGLSFNSILKDTWKIIRIYIVTKISINNININTNNIISNRVIRHQ